MGDLCFLEVSRSQALQRNRAENDRDFRGIDRIGAVAEGGRELNGIGGA